MIKLPTKWVIWTILRMKLAMIRRMMDGDLKLWKLQTMCVMRVIVLLKTQSITMQASQVAALGEGGKWLK